MILFGTEDKVDTLISPTGEFHFSRKLEHPALLTIAAMDFKNNRNSNFRRFFAGSGSGSLNSEFQNLGNSPVQLSETRYNDTYEGFRSHLNPLVGIARKVIDTSYSKQLTAEGKGLCNKLYDFINTIEDQVIEEFIRENTGNIVGAYVFNTYFKTEVNAEKARYLFDKFPVDLQQSSYLKDIFLKIAAAEKIAVGVPAPVISVTSLDGENVMIGLPQSAYTIVDFWGTWCTPCLKGIERMKNYHQKYQGRIKFISVAYNDNKSNIQKVVDENRIDWPQILNNAQKTDLVKLFNIYAAPTKILIDKNGKIEKIFVGETDAFYFYLDNLVLK
ncbi:TlpA family protein disulfide reductase [Niabella aquatica]